MHADIRRNRNQVLASWKTETPFKIQSWLLPSSHNNIPSHPLMLLLLYFDVHSHLPMHSTQVHLLLVSVFIFPSAICKLIIPLCVFQPKLPKRKNQTDSTSIGQPFGRCVYDRLFLTKYTSLQMAVSTESISGPIRKEGRIAWHKAWSATLKRLSIATCLR